MAEGSDGTDSFIDVEDDRKPLLTDISNSQNDTSTVVNDNYGDLVVALYSAIADELSKHFDKLSPESLKYAAAIKVVGEHVSTIKE